MQLELALRWDGVPMSVPRLDPGSPQTWGERPWAEGTFKLQGLRSELEA